MITESQRRALPWVKVEKEYVSTDRTARKRWQNCLLDEVTPGYQSCLVPMGRRLQELFFLGGNYNDIIVHLRHRDVHDGDDFATPLSNWRPINNGWVGSSNGVVSVNDC